jgi:hypothetical protein
MSAIYGRDVRSSIHDAIREINIAQEQSINAGTAIVDGDPAGGVYDKSYYFNTDTNDLLECDGTAWNKIDNLEGNAITSITGPVTDLTNPLIDVYTIHFSKIADRTFIVNNGRGISSITGPVVDPSTPLTDIYTINFNDGSSLPYSVTNGKGISSITGPVSVGLIDTYTINYNDGSTQPFIVTNGKDGVSWHNGIEISGKAPASTGYVLATEKCQKDDMYFNVVEGAVYVCDVGGAAGATTYWSCKFVMAGGGGGGYLYALNDVDPISVQTPTNGQILQYNGSTHLWEAKDGGSGHTMKPVPSSHPTETDVVNAINTGGLDDTNNEVASLYGISKWSNTKTFRTVLNGADGGIGHYGIGEWKWTLNNPSAADEAGWGWWQSDIFKLLGNQTLNGYDVDFKIKFVKTPNGEEILLGGYIVDCDTGYMCIKFANYVADVLNAQVVVDVTLTRNDIEYV